MTAVDTRAADPAPTARPVPYVGPRSLQADEQIYGRTREINDLRGAILSERIVLLYSQSGAGKSSLIEAGLRPALEKRRFQMLPTIRVGYEPPAESLSTNRYRLSVITSLEAGRHLEKQLASEELAAITLRDYLTQRSADEPKSDPCLIFDQFEEVFTLDPADWDEKEAFLRELGDALADRGLFALFAMREDFIAQLDPYQALVPTRFGNRYRLELLGPSAARDAIQKPAVAAGVEFTDEAADRLVDDLRRIRVDRGADSIIELGPSVEPVQLQVVCSQLWDRLPADATKIMPSNVVEGGNVNEALAGYYSSQVHTAAGKTHVREAHIREWCEDKLISDDGFRTQTREGPGRKGDAVLSELENAHLIRADRRRGTQWYELTHDRFVDPIRGSNASFRAKRRAKRTRWALGLVTAVVVAGIAGILAVAANNESVAAVLELPATPLSGSSGTASVALTATEVTRFSFDGDLGEEISLVVTADGAASDIEVRVVQSVDGDFRPVAPSGSTGEDVPLALVVETALDDAVEEEVTREVISLEVSSNETASATTSTTKAPATTSTTKAPLEVERSIERVFALPASGSYLIEISASNDTAVTLAYEKSELTPIPELTLDETLAGVIETAGAVGRFGFAGDGSAIELALDADDTLDAVLLILDADGYTVGNSAAAGLGQSEHFGGTLAMGSYTVEVSGFNGSTGGYTLTLGQTQIVPISLDQTLQGSIDNADSVGWFSFDGGSEVGLVLESLGAFDGALSVLDANGNSVGFSDTSGEGQPEYFVGILPAGAYTANVTGFDGSTGSYSLALSQQRVTPLVLDDTVDGTIDTAGAVGWFGFEGDGEAVEFVLESEDPFNGVLAIVDASGVAIGYSDSTPNGGIEHYVGTLSATEAYKARVTGWDGSTGTYSLTLRRAQTTALQRGATVTDNIDSPGSVTRFAFTGDGTTVELALRPQGNLDGVLNVVDDTGISIGYADANLEGEAESLVLALPEGTYTAEVSGFEGSTGAFTLTLQDAQITPLALAETQTGDIESAGTVARFSFATDGDVLELVLEPGDGLDGTLTVLDADGTWIDSAEATAEGDPVRLIRSLPGGSYMAEVTGLGDSTGGFALSLRRASTSPLPLGEAVEYEWRPDGGNYYTFEGTAGRVYSVTSLAGWLPITVFAPETSDPIFTATFVAPFDGEYLIVAEPLESESFTLQITEPDLVQLASGEAASGVRETSAPESAHQFAAQEGDTYTVTLDWYGGYPPDSLYVMAPDGLLEAFTFAYDPIIDLDADLTCSDLLETGLAYADAALYGFWFAGVADRLTCEGVYPADDIAAYWDLGPTARLSVEGIAPFDGTYLIGIDSLDPGSYELQLNVR